MTKIYIKGILGKKFGSFFNLNVSSASSALNAIDANRIGFIQELKKLNKKNQDYFIICDGDFIENSNQLIQRKKIKNIFIIPAIIGFGEMAAAALSLTTVTATGAVVLTTTGIIVATLINILVSTAISFGVSLLMNSLNKEASSPGQPNIGVGGVTASIEAAGKSYVFSNNQNVSEQGSSIPVGYGIMKSASQVLSSSVKDFPTDSTANAEFESLQNLHSVINLLGG